MELVLKYLWCVSAMMLIVISRVMVRVCDMIWLKPKRIRSLLSQQGIAGPKPSFLFGNVKEIQNTMMMESSTDTIISTNSPSSSVSHHQWLRSTFPYLQTWARRYGRIYTFSTGTQQHLLVNEAELIKELKLHKSLDLGKPSYLSRALEPMLGNGIIKANGHHWSFQKKLIAPEFFLHKVKGMVGLMEECTMSMITTWENRLSPKGDHHHHEFMVDQDLRGLSADIISRACFGSSYSQGKNIFAKLRDMQEALSQQSLIFGLPTLRFVPTKSNREIWRLKRQVEALILNVVKGRQEASQKDLLQMILESAATDSELQQDKRKTDRFIVDNCKNIYFAGYETTALSASWTLMLLALYPQWQQRIRAEISDNGSLNNLEKLNQLKSLTMVIQESLRLYAPSVMVAREAFADIKLGGNFQLPKGVHVWSFIPELHRDPDNWGPDAGEFKPERFAGGISEACKYPQAYIPFGYGTRLCIGQTFAMLELKIVLSLVLSRFSFSLSPNYVHSPVYKMLLMPQHGMRLLVKRV